MPRQVQGKPTTGERSEVVRIPLRDIRVNLANPRKHIDEQELAQLADSIRQHGLLQPILVRPSSEDERQRDRREYQIVIGSRRFFAAERAGLAAIDCYVRGMSSDEAVIASFLDHVHHRTLTPAEEADFLRYLRDQRKMRLREIAAIIDKSIAYVSRRLGVSEDSELDRAVQEGRISQAAAQEILRAPERWRPTLIARAEGLTTQQVRSLVNEAADSDLTPEAVERVFAVRKGATGPRPERPAVLTAQTRDAFDQTLRQDGPVTHIPPSPAFTLLRAVHQWSSALSPDWRPGPPEAQLLDEAVDLIRAVAARASQAASPAG